MRRRDCGCDRGSYRSATRHSRAVTGTTVAPPQSATVRHSARTRTGGRENDQGRRPLVEPHGKRGTLPVYIGCRCIDNGNYGVAATILGCELYAL